MSTTAQNYTISYPEQQALYQTCSLNSRTIVCGARWWPVCDVMRREWHRLHDVFCMDALRMLPSVNLQPFSDPVFSALLRLYCYSYLWNMGKYVPEREVCAVGILIQMCRDRAAWVCVRFCTQDGQICCVPVVDMRPRSRVCVTAC